MKINENKTVTNQDEIIKTLKVFYKKLPKTWHSLGLNALSHATLKPYYPV